MARKTQLTDQWGNKRRIRMPERPILQKVWFETWLVSIPEKHRQNAVHVMVYDNPEEGWTGYPYIQGVIDKTLMLHIWPHWCWKMVLGPTSDTPDPSPRPIKEAEKLLETAPFIRHDQQQFPEDPEQETTAQERIARRNFAEKQRAKTRFDRF